MQITFMKSEMGKDGDQGEGSKIQRTTSTGRIIKKHIMKIFWFLKNRIILKTYYVFFSLNKQIMIFCKEIYYVFFL